MRRVVAVLGFAFALATASASFVVLPNTTSRASGSGATFVIPAGDGYGVADCLASGGECGTIVANAWCEAQGFARAESFGLAAVEPASASAAPRASERPVTVTCGG